MLQEHALLKKIMYVHVYLICQSAKVLKASFPVSEVAQRYGSLVKIGETIHEKHVLEMYNVLCYALLYRRNG